MKIININHFDKPNLDLPKGGCFALGDLDGVHQGHAKLVQQMADFAQQSNINNFGVIVFDPNTKLWFKDKFANYELLTNNEQKYRFLADLGIPFLVIIDFAQVYHLSANQFMSSCLIECLGVKHLFTGEKTRFGSDLQPIKAVTNNFSDLTYHEVVLTTNQEGEICSSSLIKELLRSGNISRANQMLGRFFQIESRVIHGNKIGRSIGCPTANLLIQEYAKPKYGVYATRILINDLWYDSVSSFGVRPTIKNSTYEEILEVHIFDFDQNIYDLKVIVSFIDYIRPELKFSGLEELKSYIDQDIIKSKKILANMVKL